MINPLAIDYDTEMLAFRAKRDKALASSDGWLSTIGLHILDEGMNQLPFGTMKSLVKAALEGDGTMPEGVQPFLKPTLSVTKAKE